MTQKKGGSAFTISLPLECIAFSQLDRAQVVSHQGL